ncbi:MAG: hypothetical protein Q4G24_08355 [Paracoccus sp. (in: a-proteobacteria)]|uniref:hypothetical protein n=1 Tax=Paracoccus sp. TaxID=267 RepID=UPI0026E034F4|nr:hypothetical protein [Paracoccus sp. (in: a-proteobacteria)]MDO5621465.1 hypothetical protein [Paracoccus sp. (in: a-proteobacteria)]
MQDNAPAYRDRLPAPVAPEGEVARASFAPDRARYLRDYMTLAAIGGSAVVLVLLLLGKADQLWAGILGTSAALILRGGWMYADTMAMRWLLTDRSLIGPGQQVIALADIASVRAFMGDVHVTTKAGRKMLLKHLADPQAAASRIEASR